MTRGFLLRFSVFCFWLVGIRVRKSQFWDTLLLLLPRGVQKCRHNDKGDENIITTKEEFNQILLAFWKLAGLVLLVPFFICRLHVSNGLPPWGEGGDYVITSWKWLDLYQWSKIWSWIPSRDKYNIKGWYHQVPFANILNINIKTIYNLFYPLAMSINVNFD